MSSHSEEPARHLPANPDLRHLKDQAQDLLKAGQAESLARAQFQIARQYGFASWPKLKAHVESLQLTGQLKLAIDANDLAEVKRLMTRHPELHRAPLGYGQAGPLTWVTECRVPRVPPGETRLAMARWMIENGSDVHQGGDMPLMRAALDDTRLAMTELLVAHGAVSKYLPEFKNPKVLMPGSGGDSKLVSASREITIRDLLTHTSGLTYRFMAQEPFAELYHNADICDGLTRPSFTLAENVRHLASLPLLHQPGSAYQYSLSTDVLGRLVEVISGQDLESFMRSRIFEPLDMNHTYFDLPTDKTVGSYYWGGFYNTGFWVDPEKKLVGVLMTQLVPSDHLTLQEDFRKLAYAATQSVD
jgi:hypothetical protein